MFWDLECPIVQLLRKNPNNFDHQLAFFAALFACLAKIAKADGQVTTDEINKIEDFIYFICCDPPAFVFSFKQPSWQ